MPRTGLRGWNGTLDVDDDTATIRRGLKGLLVRKRRDPGMTVRLDRLTTVRFAPAGWVVGYLQLIERGSDPNGDAFLSTIRDPRTVTFFTRSGRWRRVADDLARRSGAQLEEAPAAPYRATLREFTDSRTRGS